MPNPFSRTELLLGKAAVEKLKKAHVAIFGIGGVGGYVCEALTRSGVGRLDLIDHDTVSLTNLNRQIIATKKTVGRYKTEVMKERILEINPQADVRAYQCFFLPENAASFPWEEYDYIIDAIDTVTAKIELVLKAEEKNIPIISSMGTGNKLDASLFRVADIYQTKVCPLAKVMRHELRKRGIKKLKVVYSEEVPICPGQAAEAGTGPVSAGMQEEGDMASAMPEAKTAGRRAVPGSVAFVPPAAGLMMAGEVIKDITRRE